MANINEAFPSKFLSAADLMGNTVRVQINNVIFEDVGRGADMRRKPVVYFFNKSKGLALNKTNANMIAAAYGNETENWRGAEVELFPTVVDFQGRSVDAIRVRVPPRSARPAEQMPPSAPVNAPPPRPQREDFQGPATGNGSPLRTGLSDDIPF